MLYKDWKVIGYCVTRGTTSILIYDEVAGRWRRKFSDNYIFVSLAEAQNSLARVNTCKKTAIVMEVIDHSDMTLSLGKVGGLDAIRRVREKVNSPSQ